MKSLEFANEYRNITVKSMNEYIDNCDKYGQEINECYFNMLEEQLAHFDIIKQDLERLELLEKAIEIIKKPKNKDGLYTSFYDGVGVNEQEEEILIKVIGDCEDDEY